MARIRRRRNPQPAPATPLAALLDEHLRHLAVKGFTESTLQMRRVHIEMFLGWCRELRPARSLRDHQAHSGTLPARALHYRKDNGDPLTFRTAQPFAGAQGMVPLAGPAELHPAQPGLGADPAPAGEPAPQVRPDGRGSRAGDATTRHHYAGRLARSRHPGDCFTRPPCGAWNWPISSCTDIDHRQRAVMIRQGKGRKDRVVPVGERALAWLDKYLHEIRPELAIDPDDGTVFLTAEGEPFSPNHLSALVRDYVEAAATGKSGACHLFRHTMATLMHEGGADIRYIQQMLGHAKLDTTQIYTHVSVRMLKEIHSATHPGAKLEADANDKPQRDKRGEK